MRTISYRGYLVARSSIAHGGKESGTTHTLRREALQGTDGRLHLAIPVISGGTIRGSLRRVAAAMTHEGLVGSDRRLPFDAVNALRSGGALRETRSGREVLTGERQAVIRDVIPMLGLFGLSAGGRIMSGRLMVDKAIPVAQETAWLAQWLALDQQSQHLTSVFQLIQREEYSRRADVTDAGAQGYIDRTDGQVHELPKGGGQMAYTIETLVAGTRLYHEVRGEDLLPAEAAFLDELITRWPAAGFVGGHKARGMGRIATNYTRSVTDLAGAPAQDESPVDWRTHMREHPDLERALSWL